MRMKLSTGWYVFKIGGELALSPPSLAKSLGYAVRTCLRAGAKVAIVHGAGPQGTELAARLALPVRKVAGLRVTDVATLQVMQYAHGAVSTSVARALALARVPAMCAVCSPLVRARRTSVKTVNGEQVDYGLVGEVTRVDVALFEGLAEAGLVPVIGYLAADGRGGVFNVNADTIAARVARALRARALVLVSNVPGVLRQRDDPSSRIARLSASVARRHITDGTIADGMLPKVEEGLGLVRAGVGAVHIVGAVPPSAIADELRRPGSRGTVFVADASRSRPARRRRATTRRRG